MIPVWHMNSSHRLERSPGFQTRSRLVALLLLVTALAGAGGFAVATQMQSSADAAAEREPPEPSPISVAVELRELSSSITIRGVVEFPDAFDVELAGPVGGTVERQVITVAPTEMQLVADGDVIAQVSGRPIILVRGAEPSYRTLRGDSVGTDVLQLENALVRFGFDPGEVDEHYTRSTARAVAAWYESLGFVASGRTDSSTRNVVVPAGEIVFLPTLPARINEVLAPVGTTVSGPVLKVTTEDRRVTAILDRVDRNLVTEGMPVMFEVDDTMHQGTIEGIEDADSESFQLVIVPAGAIPDELTSPSAKVVIPIVASDGPVLVVPIAAVSTGADGVERVTVFSPDGALSEVEIVTGLAAEGYVEIVSVPSAELVAGDLVVVSWR